MLLFSIQFTIYHPPRLFCSVASSPKIEISIFESFTKSHFYLIFVSTRKRNWIKSAAVVRNKKKNRNWVDVNDYVCNLCIWHINLAINWHNKYRSSSNVESEAKHCISIFYPNLHWPMQSVPFNACRMMYFHLKWWGKIYATVVAEVKNQPFYKSLSCCALSLSLFPPPIGFLLNFIQTYMWKCYHCWCCA